MTELMRRSLSALCSEVESAHAGLLIQRGLQTWEDGEKIVKQKLIEKICKVKPTELYLLAFNRWLNQTHESGREDMATVTAKIEGRLFTGLPLGGTLETGAATHHTYGMPMLAGSSVKGAVRSYTEHLFAQRDENGNLQFKTLNNANKILIQKDKQKVLDILFGADEADEADENTSANAGYLIWHDAWWIPKVNNSGKLLKREQCNPFVEDIVTVHHQSYYSGETAEALDMENPVPNQQLAIQGAFYFAIQGEKKWVNLAKELLELTIQNTGLGSKATSGYGYFVLDDTLKQDMDRRFARYEMSKPIDITADPLAEIRKVIKYMEEKQLIEGLSRGKKALFNKLNLDKDNDADIANVRQVVLEEHADWVAKWEGDTGRNPQRAYKFIYPTNN